MEVKYPFLAIDPGVNIGMALFWKEFDHPIWTNCIQARQNMGWELNSQLVLFAYANEIEKHKQVTQIYIEKPKFMESSLGMTSARNEGLFKLISVYGAMLYISRQANYDVYEIDVNWKGNLDKKKLAERLKRKHNMIFSDHVADAVGIGLYLKGLF
jgi:hypothetical protein